MLAAAIDYAVKIYREQKCSMPVAAMKASQAYGLPHADIMRGLNKRSAASRFKPKPKEKPPRVKKKRTVRNPGLPFKGHHYPGIDKIFPESAPNFRTTQSIGTSWLLPDGGTKVLDSRYEWHEQLAEKLLRKAERKEAEELFYSSNSPYSDYLMKIRHFIRLNGNAIEVWQWNPKTFHILQDYLIDTNLYRRYHGYLALEERKTGRSASVDVQEIVKTPEEIRLRPYGGLLSSQEDSEGVHHFLYESTTSPDMDYNYVIKTIRSRFKGY